MVDDDERLPAETRDRIIMHGEQSPYHRRVRDRLRKEEGMDYDDIETYADLRTVFEYMDDDDLLETGKDDLVPDHYDEDELLLSRSSGTTGEPKEVYWHKDDIDANIDSMEQNLREAGVPEGEYWLATATPNPTLQYTMEELAERFDAEGYDIIEVDPRPIKRALRSGDEQRIRDAFADAAEEVLVAFEENDVGVYEDIAPMMEFVSSQLPDDAREDVDAALIGGVGTDEETVSTLQEEVFDDAVLTGWYGDYMNGFSMMHEPGELEYVPEDNVVLEVRSFDDLDEPVATGEEGEIISHAIRRGHFVPNRRIGDRGRSVTLDGEDGVTDIGRL